MKTVGELRWESNEKHFLEMISTGNVKELLQLLEGYNNYILGTSEEVKRVYEDCIYSRTGKNIFTYGLIASGHAWNIPSNFFEMSYFQQKAASQGLESFVVFTPTEWAETRGYTEMYYPIEEGLAKWEEYKAEGLDSLFVMYTHK